ncbi:MAG: hypothetical protein C0600_16525 [Ignavibacteria bacterium]|nr:MAG: hypothetical protein C0600_16525 [Ignavibacteria bacterium]
MGRSFLISVIAGLTLGFASLSAQNTGPRLQWTPTVLQFDTVSCGASVSATIEMENVGDTPLTVSECDAPTEPFSGTLPTPFTLQPAEKRLLTLHYAPTRAPLHDSLRLKLRADSPVPTAMGFLFDISDGMAGAFGSSTRIEAAHEACASFLDQVMTTGAPAHQGGVYAYSTSANYRLLRGLSSDRQKLQGAFPSAANGAHACAWDAMQRTITNMQTSPLRKFLIVLSGSEDAGVANCGPHSAAGVVNSAVAAGIAVYTISFAGEDEAQLRNIAEQTGGRYIHATTDAELQSAMDAIVGDLQYDVPQHVVLRGEAVTPLLAFSTDHIVFPATMVGDTSDVRFTLRNTGTAPLHLNNIDGLSLDMTLILPDVPVMPDDSFIVAARFHPRSQDYSHAVCTFTYNACGGGTEVLHLYGMGYEQDNPSIGPVLGLTPERVDFGKVTCSAGKSLILVAENTGDAQLQLMVVPVTHQRFLLQNSSLSIDPGASADITLSYVPRQYLGTDAIDLEIVAPVRESATTVVACNLGSSALGSVDATLRRFEAWDLELSEIVAGLTTSGSIHDSIAVIVADSSIRVALPFTPDRREAASVRLQAAAADSTMFLDALAAGLQLFRPSSQQKRLVLLTSEGDAGAAAGSTAHFKTCAAIAQQRGITVSCILLGDDAGDSLQYVCEQSGGLFRRAADMIDLREAIEHLEKLVLAPKTYSVPVSAESVSGDLRFAADTLHFPETWVGESSCTTVTLYNTGEGTLVIDDALQGMFTLQAAFPVTIPPMDSMSVEICFTPERPNNFSGSIIFQTNSCLPGYSMIFCTGSARDSLSMNLKGSYTVRPGGVVDIPIFAGRTLTEGYGLRSLGFGIAYNPTLLYPDFDRPLVMADGSALPGTSQVPKQEYDTDRNLATTLYRISRTGSDAALTTTGNDNVLCFIRMHAYLGNATSATVSLDSAITWPMNIGFPVWGEATVELDGLPWLEQRLVDPSALYGVTIGKHSPNPVRNVVRLHFACERQAGVRMTLHDAMGRQLRILTDAEYAAGAHTLHVDTEDLPAGLYYYRVQSGGRMQSRLMLITR